MSRHSRRRAGRPDRPRGRDGAARGGRCRDDIDGRRRHVRLHRSGGGRRLHGDADQDWLHLRTVEPLGRRPRVRPRGRGFCGHAGGTGRNDRRRDRRRSHLGDTEGLGDGERLADDLPLRVRNHNGVRVDHTGGERRQREHPRRRQRDHRRARGRHHLPLPTRGHQLGRHGHRLGPHVHHRASQPRVLTGERRPHPRATPATANLAFTVILSAVSSKTVRVDYSTANGTAVAGQDYLAASGTLIYSPGQTSKQISVGILGDHLDENNETFTLGLSNPLNATITAGTATITITDDDTAPTATTLPASAITETGATLNGQANPNGKQTTVRFDYGTTTSYGNQTTNQVIPAGLSPVATNAPLASLQADTTYHYRLVATSAAGTSTGADTTFTTGRAGLTLSPASVAAPEGDTGTANLAFTVTLSAVSSKTVRVDYATANGTAVAGQDYLAAGGTLIYSPGQTSKQINVGILGDHLDENTETFTLGLSNPLNATIAAGTATITIADDDTAPTATTLAASGVAETAATLNGQANPNGKQTTVRFDYGTTTSYGNQTTNQVIPAGLSPVATNAPLASLQADTTYHYRLVLPAPPAPAPART